MRRPLAALAALVALTALSWASLSAVMLVAPLGLLAIALVLQLLFEAVKWLVRRDPASRKSVARAAAWLAFCVVASLAMGGAHRARVRHTERALRPIIDALERHRQRTGAYPAALRELVPADLPALPGEPCAYSTREQGYSLTFMTFGMNHHSWDAREQAWHDWD